jgi:hypothetical protein
VERLRDDLSEVLTAGCSADDLSGIMEA